MQSEVQVDVVGGGDGGAGGVGRGRIVGRDVGVASLDVVKTGTGSFIGIDPGFLDASVKGSARSMLQLGWEGNPYRFKYHSP